jgi:hypothetical protein
MFCCAFFINIVVAVTLLASSSKLFFNPDELAEMGVPLEVSDTEAE